MATKIGVLTAEQTREKLGLDQKIEKRTESRYIYILFFLVFSDLEVFIPALLIC